MAQIDKFTAFLKPGNSWVMEGGKKVGQRKKGSTVTNTSIAGRASTSRSGKQTPKNSGKGGGGSASKAPTVKSSAKNVVKRLKAGNVAGAVISAKNLGRTTKKAVTGAAKSAAKTASSKVNLAKIKYKPKLRAAKAAAKSAYEKVDTKAERKTIVRKFKRKATDAVFGKDTGGRNAKRTGGAVGAVKAWGSAAQRAAIKKLAEFNRGKKRKIGGGGK